jgi:hypothetical protein
MRLANAALALLSVIVALLAAEVALRLVGLPFDDGWTPSEYAMARFDPELGWSYVPGRSVVQTFGEPPREVSKHFDAFGARVPSPERPSVGGIPSVLLVGDSFAMGHGVTYEESLAGRLDEALDLQVVNLGVQAYGTAQALLRLRGAIDRFETRAVVHTFIGEHVLRDAIEDRRLLLPTARFHGTKPRFALDRQGRLVRVHEPRPHSEHTYSRLVAAVRSAYLRRGPGPDPAVTRALLREMHREVRARGAAFLVVNWEQAAYPGRRDVFEGLDVPWIDAREGAPAGWDEWVIAGDGHPDARAHAHVARRVLEALRLVEPSSADRSTAAR